MIQILICDKIYITPEMKKKKRLYKLYFILSVILVIFLVGYYIYQEYDRNASEQLSQEILHGLTIPAYNVATVEQMPDIEDDTTVSVENNVIVVVLNDEPGEEINIDELVYNAEQQITQNTQTNIVAMPQIYTAKDGTQYHTIATITIPNLGITYPVLSEWNYDLLKVAPCLFWGPKPNEVGNCCIIGHNYRNDKFFSKLDTLSITDVIEIQDMSGRTIRYAIYDKYVVDPTDVSCTSQLTNGRRDITLITCYNSGKQRTVIKATEIK